ncbi:MAG: TIGR02171 family protein [Fibrobacter sp.]|nr:TIGR02171 family protein [Fibrobacter sp.]
MKFVGRLVLVWSLSLLGACSNSVLPDDDSFVLSHSYVLADSLASDMVRILATGKSVSLGSNEGLIKERPSMRAEFGYDYSIGRHEVTCSEYNKFMSKHAKVYCPSTGRPAADVTFYDAVLFANARSKDEGLDTAYTYVGTSFDDKGHCVGLEGYAFNPNVDAYRLPTEAEWMLAASVDWSPRKSLFYGTRLAEYLNLGTHEVCKTNMDATFCDMEGNVMEWVNDWFGLFKDTTVANYVGAPNGGNLGERVLKGGSYRTDLATFKPYSRGDVYTITSTTRTYYLGLRLAFGKIPNPTYLTSTGKVSETPVVPIANAVRVHDLTGTFKTKLVFRNDATGNLAYVDYSIGGMSAIEIEDTLDAYHPEISPDGKLVAFCTGIEGVEGKSSVYVRELTAKGSRAVRLDVESAAIPRWSVLENGDTAIVYVSGAANNKSDADFAKASTWQVVFANGEFKTPQKLFDGSYHGGVSDDGALAVTGARLLRARVHGANTLWYSGEQACNVSLSKTGKQTLFLDFGGAPGRKFTGVNYGTHEMILIVDSLGNLVQGIPSPSGYSFDHTEWADDLVVATLTNAGGSHEKIVLLNPKDSSVMDLVKGDEIWHPSLWIQKSEGSSENYVDIDSAGVYYGYSVFYGYSSATAEVAIKIQKFWQVYKEVEFISMGSSMILNAVIDDSITAYKPLNMAFTLGDLFAIRFLLDTYVFPFAKNVKVIMIELNPGFMFRTRQEFWNFIYSNSPGLKYDRNHLSEATKDDIARYSQVQEYSMDLLSSDYIEGTFLLPTIDWNKASVTVDTTLREWDDRNLKNSFSSLAAIKRKAEERGIKVFLAITPRSPDYRSTGSYCLFGPRRSVAEKIIQKAKDMGFYVFDENKGGNHDYSDRMANNSVHLSIEGAKQFTSRLDSLLKARF